MFCFCRFPFFSSIPFFRRGTYFSIRDNLCTPLQWQRIVKHYMFCLYTCKCLFLCNSLFWQIHIFYKGQTLQSTSVAENCGQVDLDIYYYFIISIYVDVHISALLFLAQSSLGKISSFAFHFSGRELCRIRFCVSIHVDNHFSAIPFLPESHIFY